LIEGERTKILVDAGLSARTLKERLEYAYVSPGEIEGIVITHAHIDHTGGLPVWVKRYKTPVYVHYKTAPVISELLGGYTNIVEIDDNDFFIGELTVSPVTVSHDVPCIGCSVYSAGRKISVLTDLGILPERTAQNISDSDIVLLEANHDVDMLLANPRYPAQLKRRILSNRGHLSNADCAEAAVRCARGGVRQLILGHLSEQNNAPSLAYESVARRLEEEGFAPGREVFVAVAVQSVPTGIFRIS
jgi:phosphoribosyl 1,2-cyclic phosphodiesterase